jgi:hypothetical protein
MKENTKIIIALTVGMLISGVVVYAGTLLKASEVSYNETTVNDALNELFDLANKKGPTKVDAKEGATYKGIVYLDPTDLTKECDVTNSVSTTETKIGCMKWYIYKESTDSYTMILDHNAIALVAWNSGNSNSTKNELSSALTYLTSTSGWKVTPRLITTAEVAAISGNTNFNFSTTTSYSGYFYLETNTSTAPSTFTDKYAWLYDYTYGCTSYGCNIEDNNTYAYYSSTSTAYVYGYYTNDQFVGDSVSDWSVALGGSLTLSSLSYNAKVGLRPVITISKDLFE